MHHYVLGLFLTFSIALPGIAGIIRFRQILWDYYPFLFLIFLGLANELVSIISIHISGTNAINGNVYVLLEYILLLYQFLKWNSLTIRMLRLMAIAGILLWITDNFIFSQIVQNNSLFRSCYSLAIVFLSIDRLNKLLIYEKGALLKNATFLICVTFLIYYGCKAFVEAFNAFHLGLSHMILWNLWIILYFVSAIANIFYAIAILCIPRKREFILPY